MCVVRQQQCVVSQQQCVVRQQWCSEVAVVRGVTAIVCAVTVTVSGEGGTQLTVRGFETSSKVSSTGHSHCVCLDLCVVVCLTMSCVTACASLRHCVCLYLTGAVLIPLQRRGTVQCPQTVVFLEDASLNLGRTSIVHAVRLSALRVPEHTDVLNYGRLAAMQ